MFQTLDLRFTLASFLAFIGILAIAITALGYASPNWASVLLTGTVVALFVGVAKAVTSRGRSFAFWAAFTLWGWGYLLLAFSHTGMAWSRAWWGRMEYSGATGAEGIADSLITTRLLRWAHATMPLRTRAHSVGSRVTVGPYPATILSIKDGQYKIHYDGWSSNWDEWVSAARLGPRRTWADFHQVGQSLWALLFALCGGLVARRWYRPDDGKGSEQCERRFSS